MTQIRDAVRDAYICYKSDMGFVNMEADGDELTITTCFQNDCAATVRVNQQTQL